MYWKTQVSKRYFTRLTKIVSVDVALVRTIKTFKSDPITEQYRADSFAKQIISKKSLSYLHHSSGWIRDRSITALNSWAQDADELNSTVNWNGVLPGQEKELLISLSIPNNARSIRHASFVDVSYEIVVTTTPAKGKLLEVVIPITILAQVSVLPETPHLNGQESEVVPGRGSAVDYVESERAASPGSEPERPSVDSIAAYERDSAKKVVDEPSVQLGSLGMPSTTTLTENSEPLKGILLFDTSCSQGCSPQIFLATSTPNQAATYF